MLPAVDRVAADPSGTSRPNPSSPAPARWRRRAAWTLVVALGVAALVALALASAVPPQQLDPDDTGPTGSKALVQVLRHHGVDVQVVLSIATLERAAPGPGSTVVLGNPAYLGHTSSLRLARAATTADRLVLLSPTTLQLDALRLPVAAGPVAAHVSLTATCSGDVARADDTVDLVDVRFLTRDAGAFRGATPCFALPDGRADSSQQPSDFAFGAAMATFPAVSDRPEVVALGFGGALTNRFVDDASHAGLAVRALGRSGRLIWYQPDIADLAEPPGAVAASVWPTWLVPAAAVGATAVVVLALVRGRRLGPLVTEPLPVVVRAVETTESRGRIYRRAQDRARAAAILRRATGDRLTRRLAVPPPVGPVLHHAAAAASGMPVRQVATLLTGPPPATDAELQALATALTDLEERVRAR